MNHGALELRAVLNRAFPSSRTSSECFAASRITRYSRSGHDRAARSARGALVKSPGRGSESERSGQHGVT